MTKLTVGECFAGIGGFGLGLERTGGFEVRWQIEIDDYCRRVLEKHWPDIRRFGDIRELAKQRILDELDADLICGGFPCQPVSQAGLRLGEEDERWLWPDFFRILRTIRPRYVLVENTSGLATLGMGRVLGDLASIRYDAEWQSIPAAAVGAPHIRDRVWILAYPRRELQQGGIYPIRRGELLSEGNGRDATIGREDRELVEMVPGIHPRVATDWWLAQSRMDRSADGFSAWTHRVKALGNAVVPQVATWIGQRILDYESSLTEKGM